MIQTTNGVLNMTLYDQITPHALLAWHRVRLANWLASSGMDWAGIVSQYNSGITYCHSHAFCHLISTSLSYTCIQEHTTISIW